VVSAPAGGNGGANWPTKSDGGPDFAKMTSQQRLAYHSARLNRQIDGRN
jgi:hypothetical protein